MKRILTLTAILALSSCTTPCVDIGGAIKYSTEHYTAVNLGETSNGQAYQCKNGDYYMHVPVLSYTRTWPAFHWSSFELSNRESDKQATGEYQWIRLSKTTNRKKAETTGNSTELKGYKDFRVVKLTSQPKLANTKKVENPIEPRYQITNVLSGTPQEEPSTALKIIAAPFDYAIDPVLTITSMIVFVPTAVVTGIIASPFTYFFSEE